MLTLLSGYIEWKLMSSTNIKNLMLYIHNHSNNISISILLLILTFHKLNFIEI